MPCYIFENVKTGEVHEVVYHMTDTKDYRGPKGTAKPGTWRRVWIKPQMAVDALPVDPYSSKDFARVTRKKGTLGELWDRSSEWGEKRKDKDGVDPLQEKFFDNYAKQHKGRPHPIKKQREERAKTTKALKKAGIRVDWGSED